MSMSYGFIPIAAAFAVYMLSAEAPTGAKTPLAEMPACKVSVFDLVHVRKPSSLLMISSNLVVITP